MSTVEALLDVANAPGDSTDIRGRLLRAALAAFREEGYRASIERIAARAGVARQTLYNHFPAKVDLFREVIRLASADLLVSLNDDGMPLRDRLRRFALIFRSRLLSPEGIAFFRSLVSEAVHLPDLASAFYNNGPAQTEQRLAGVLAAAMVTGELRHDDPAFAARMLISMLIEGPRTRCLFMCAEPDLPSPANTDQILDTFLRAFGTTTLRSPS
jgi:TetR/AcrR family transcriptional repressor of mexJK operon